MPEDCTCCPSTLHISTSNTAAPSAIVTENSRIVQEAAKLFEADLNRMPYRATSDSFVVSPFNSRKRLSAFIKQARRQLLVYDPAIRDKEMLSPAAGEVEGGRRRQNHRQRHGAKLRPEGGSADQHAPAHPSHDPRRARRVRRQPEPPGGRVRTKARDWHDRSRSQGRVRPLATVCVPRLRSGPNFRIRLCNPFPTHYRHSDPH